MPTQNDRYTPAEARARYRELEARAGLHPLRFYISSRPSSAALDRGYINLNRASLDQHPRDEIDFILGHEIAHQLRYQQLGAWRMRLALFPGHFLLLGAALLLFSFALAGNPAVLSLELGLALMFPLARALDAASARDEERLADCWSCELLATHAGAVGLFIRMGQQYPAWASPGFTWRSLWESHPSLEQRIRGVCSKWWSPA